MKFIAGDKVRVKNKNTVFYGLTFTIQFVDEDVQNMPYKVQEYNEYNIWFREDDLELAQPVTVTISADEYTNFQEMEKLLAKMLDCADDDTILHYQLEIEKLLKNKYNP